MTQNYFDIIIIGGGINGAGIARDCALRGLKTLILDKGDFASGTSSKSTKLVHGGIRYLENFEFKLVWEALHERKTLTRIAPHLVKPIPFIIPVYKGDKRPLWLTRLGMFLYDLLAMLPTGADIKKKFLGGSPMGSPPESKKIPKHKNLSAAEIVQILPGIKTEGLKGGGIYYDCQTNDARLTLANIKDAVAHGAVAKNYTEVVSIKAHENFGEERLENCAELICQDVLTAEKLKFTTSLIVNATGPWLDQNLQKWHLDGRDCTDANDSNGKNSSHTDNLLRLTKGIHFFVTRLSKTAGNADSKNVHDHAILISAKKDNRVFFVIPHGKFSLVGTTDTDFKENPDNVKVEEKDIQYLLDELNRLFPGKNLSKKDVFGEYAGLRPLLNSEPTGGSLYSGEGGSKIQTTTGAVTREYKIKKISLVGATIFNVIGGKITTYRNLAQKVTDIICRQFLEVKNQNDLHITKKQDKSVHVNRLNELNELEPKQLGKCQTARLPLPISPLDSYTAKNSDGLLEPKNGAKSVPGHKLSSQEKTTEGASCIIPESNVTWDDLTYAIQHEFVRTPEDFIYRRTELYFFSKKYPDLKQLIQHKLLFH